MAADLLVHVRVCLHPLSAITFESRCAQAAIGRWLNSQLFEKINDLEWPLCGREVRLYSPATVSARS